MTNDSVSEQSHGDMTKWDSHAGYSTGARLIHASTCLPPTVGCIFVTSPFFVTTQSGWWANKKGSKGLPFSYKTLQVFGTL
jgi:hypothetical protein